MVQHFTSLEGIDIHNTWLTIGSFDGIHIGHQQLIHELNRKCHQVGGTSVVLTFHPHPAVVLRGRVGAFYLTTLSEKLELLDDLGADIVITQPFTHQLSRSSAKDFIILLKEHLDFNQLWVGHDFALGKGREGNINFLRDHQGEYGYTLKVVEPVVYDGRVASSSLIRGLIKEGNITEANKFLGRAYQVKGVVVHGDGRGKTIGIPTANLDVGDEKLIPGAGVYACKAFWQNSHYSAAVNVGTRPTFDSTDQKSHVEAHILDFSTDLYNETIKLEFIEWLRGEEKFQSVDELILQIYTDINQTRKIISSIDSIQV